MLADYPKNVTGEITLEAEINHRRALVTEDFRKLVRKIRNSNRRDGKFIYYEDGLSWQEDKSRLSKTQVSISHCDDKTVIKLMEDYSNTKIIYYTLVNLLCAAVAAGVILFLQWPLLAEIPLAAALYVEIFAVGKYFFNTWIRKKKYTLSQLVEGLRLEIKQLNQTEREAG